MYPPGEQEQGKDCGTGVSFGGQWPGCSVVHLVFSLGPGEIMLQAAGKPF